MGQIKKHTVLQSVILHILPGILVGTVYFLLVGLFTNAGLPSILALVASAVLVLIPFELGAIYFISRKNPEISFKSVMYKSKMKPLLYVIIILVIILTMALIFTFMKGVDTILENSIFGFFPESLKLVLINDIETNKTVLWLTFVLGFIILVILAPIAEEIYFRGYLLPRTPGNKYTRKLLHSLLFAMYHIWTPWMIVTRFIGMLPLIYFVEEKKNIYLGIISHCILNSIDFIGIIVFIYSIT